MDVEIVVGTVVVDPLKKIFRRLLKNPDDFVVVKCGGKGVVDRGK